MWFFWEVSVCWLSGFPVRGGLAKRLRNGTDADRHIPICSLSTSWHTSLCNPTSPLLALTMNPHPHPPICLCSTRLVPRGPARKCKTIAEAPRGRVLCHKVPVCCSAATQILYMLVADCRSVSGLPTGLCDCLCRVRVWSSLCWHQDCFSF